MYIIGDPMTGGLGDGGPIVGTVEARRYFQEIATEMVLLLPITMDEAVGRINRHFAGQQFITLFAVGVLLHEEQDVWARHTSAA